MGLHTVTANTTTTCPGGTPQNYSEQEFYTIELVAPSLPDAESPETGEIICTPSESSTPPVVAVNFNFENGPIFDDDFLAQAQVDDNSNFSSPEIDLTYINSGTISSFLPEDFDGQSKDFHWRVRGKNEAGYGPWTDPIRFTLKHQPSCY